MSAGNSITIIGNATRDPELRFTPSGQGVASFGLAVNRRWQNKQTNEWEEVVSFFDVVAWGSLGENVAESVTKGARLIVVGRLDQRSWESDSGEKRSKVPKSRSSLTRSVRRCGGLQRRCRRTNGDPRVLRNRARNGRHHTTRNRSDGIET